MAHVVGFQEFTQRSGHKILIKVDSIVAFQIQGDSQLPTALLDGGFEIQLDDESGKQVESLLRPR